MKGPLSTISDNVFVATVDINKVAEAFRTGQFAWRGHTGRPGSVAADPDSGFAGKAALSGTVDMAEPLCPGVELLCSLAVIYFV